jgi:hypothetical protein
MVLTISEKNEIVENAIHIIESDNKLMKRFISLVKRLSKKYNYENIHIITLIKIYTNAINRYNSMYVYDEYDGLSETEAVKENNLITSIFNNIFENAPIDFLQELHHKLKSRYYIY